MRGSDAVTGSMFAFVDIEARIREDHPIRTIRRVVNDILASLDRAGAAAARFAAADVLLDPF